MLIDGVGNIVADQFLDFFGFLISNSILCFLTFFFFFLTPDFEIDTFLDIL